MSDLTASDTGGEERSVEGEGLRGLDAAAAFAAWLDQFPLPITTIDPDRNTGTPTFYLASPGEVRAFAAEEDGKKGVYYTLAQVAERPNQKPRKSHLRGTLFAHADLDAPYGLTPDEVDAWVEETLERVRELTAGWPPSAIIRSGNGLHLIWRLDAFFDFGDPGDAEERARRIAEFESRTRGIRVTLNADRGTHNADRLLRLPGPKNRPNRKKRAGGRVTRETSIVYLSDRTHPLEVFPQAWEDDESGSGGGDDAQRGAVSLERETPIRLNDPAELDEWNVLDKVKMLIVLGDDPDNPYKSRSDAQWFVTCELVRRGVPPARIVGILTDKTWPISGHIRDQKRSDEYAWEQVEKATAEVAAQAKSFATTEDGKRILDPTDPYQTALRLRGELFPDAIHTNDDWLQWRSGAYRVVEDETVKSLLWEELDEAKVRVPRKQGPPTLDRFKPNRAKVGEIVAAMQGIAHQPADTMAPPVWLDGDGPPPLEIVALRNGLLHVPTGELLPPTPRFYTRNALDLEFDPNALKPVEWLAFVEDVLPDPIARDLLQDFMAYLLVPDVSQQKILLMVGPPRAGKGVTQRIITQLVGEGNTCSPLSGDLANAGVGMMQPLIGKTVAFMSDARFGRHAHGHTVTEKLLTISGGDNITISRKHKDAWTGRLPTRFVLLSNELPGLRDNSPALANRFVPLLFEKSFLGREDPTLADRIIETELPGILNWTLEGWRRMRDRGRFLLPRASEEAIEEILELGSPVAAFVRQFCILGPEKRVDKRMLFAKWKEYRKETDEHAGSLEHFARDLYAATNSKVRSVRETEGERSYSFAGIALRDFGDPY